MNKKETKGINPFISEILMLNNKFKAAERYYERLIWHEDNFKKTLEGDFLNIKPITVDFILNNECNYSCRGCTFDFIRKQQQGMARKSMTEENITILISKLKNAGTKSLIFSGGGEPTIHRKLVHAMSLAKQEGFDVSLYTNGSYQKENLSEKIIGVEPTYVRVSLNAGKKMHQEFHRTKKIIMELS
ncbi:radical SAM protein [Candidatus Woesearchaeota archaeon]|nr:radical SAM protein [Candidatus Woesearchaeota archaeon]